MGRVKLYKSIEAYFYNKEIFQVLLKFNNQTELTDMEMKDLDYWVLAYSHRDELFNQLKKTIEVQKEIEKINAIGDIGSILSRIKHIVPDKYVKISQEEDIAIIRSNLLKGVKEYGNEIVLKLIKDHMWWGILSFLLIFLAIFILIYLIIRFHYS